MDNRPIFLCYRQVDGQRYARWIYSTLKRTLESKGDSREIYFDQTAPSTTDWTAIHGAALQRAGSLVVICTPGLSVEHAEDDWVHRELDWWLKNRRVAPILIDVTGEGVRWVPPKIRTRWPNAQLVNLDRELWSEADDQEQTVVASQVAEQILGGISGSQFEVVRQDLIATKRLNRRLGWLSGGLVLMLIIAAYLSYYAAKQTSKAKEQTRIANINLSTALAERALRVGADNYNVGLLMTAEALGYADTFEARNAFITLFQRNATVRRFFPGSYDILAHPEDRRFIAGTTVWDIGSGRGTPLPLGSGSSPLALRSDGKVAAFCDRTGTEKTLIRILDLSTGQDLVESEFGESFCTKGRGVFTASGEQILVAIEGKIMTWNLKTRQAATTALEKWTEESVILDSQARLAAAGNERGTVTIWDVATGKVINSSTQHKAEVSSLSFNRQSNLLASADENGAVIVWDVMPLKPKMTLKHHESVQSLAFTPDGLRLAAGGPTRFGGMLNFGGKTTYRISLWNLDTGQQSGSSLELRTPIWSMHFIDRGRKLIAGGVTEMRLFDVPPTLVLFGQESAGPSSSEPTLTAMSDRLFASIHDRVLKCTSRLTEHETIEYSIPTDVEPLSLTVRDEIVAIGGKSGSLLLTDPVHGTLRSLGQHPSEASVLSFSPGGDLLAAAGKSGSVSLWNVQRAQRLWTQKLRGHVSALAVSADGTVAAGGAADSKGFLWLLSEGNRSREIEKIEPVSSLCLSPNGTLLAVGEGKAILLLDLKTLVRSEELFYGESVNAQRLLLPASSLAFSPDGKLLMSGSWDGKVRVFDVSARQRLGTAFTVPGTPEVGELFKKNQSVDLSHITIGRDGVVSAIANGFFVQCQLGSTEALRNRACEIANRNFTVEEWKEFFPATPVRSTCPDLPAPQ